MRTMLKKILLPVSLLILLIAFADLKTVFAGERTITVNQNYTDSLSDANEVDTFSFTTTKHGKFRVKLSKEKTNGGSYYFRLIDPGKAMEFPEIYINTNEQESYSDYYRLPPGSYQVSVRSYIYAGAVPYTIHVEFADESASGFEHEWNNSLATAQPIGNNQTLKGNLNVSGDVDYYRLNLPRTGRVSLEARTSSLPSGGFYVSVWADKGIGTNEKLIERYFGWGTERVSIPNFRLPAGNFYIGIRESTFNNSDYQLTVSYQEEDSELIEKEWNDSPETAYPFALNQTVVGNLSTPHDVDYYMFEIKKAGEATLNILKDADNTGAYKSELWGYDSAGKPVQLSTDYLYKDKLAHTVTKRLEVGKYFIKVSNWSHSAENYMLLINIDVPKPLSVAVFRAGHSDYGVYNYKVGEQINLAARGEGGFGPYKYQFYAIRPNGSRVNFRSQPVYSNVYPWTPVTAGTYEVGVDIYDEIGEKVTAKTFRITVEAPNPLSVAVFRAGYSESGIYKIGDQINLAARGEGGKAPYKYQFYAIRPNGSHVNFRSQPVYSNVYPWTPVTAGTYDVGVDIYDANGAKVTAKTVRITVEAADPLSVAVFRAGYKTSYNVGETVALAARGEGGSGNYQYQFYLYRSNGAKVVLKNFCTGNVCSWKPQTPDHYRVCVDIKDSSGVIVTKEIEITVR